MSKNKYDRLFNSNLESNRISLIFFSYLDKVKNDEKEKKELIEAFSNAYSIAQRREFNEAQKGIYR